MLRLYFWVQAKPIQSVPNKVVRMKNGFVSYLSFHGVKPWLDIVVPGVISGCLGRVFEHTVTLSEPEALQYTYAHSIVCKWFWLAASRL